MGRQNDPTRRSGSKVLKLYFYSFKILYLRISYLFQSFHVYLVACCAVSCHEARFVIEMCIITEFLECDSFFERVHGELLNI